MEYNYQMNNLIIISFVDMISITINFIFSILIPKINSRYLMEEEIFEY